MFKTQNSKRIHRPAPAFRSFVLWVSNLFRISDFDIRASSPALKWRRRNAYYYGWLEKIYRFVVRPGSRVLHIGCECGDLLAAVNPSYGVGIDGDAVLIETARQRFPGLHFHTMAPQDFELQEEFDYILICNSLGQWQDIQQVFERARRHCGEHTRMVVTYYSHLWESVLRLGSLVKLRRADAYQNWLPTPDIANLLELSGYDVIRSGSHVLLPKRIWPLTVVCNYLLSLLPVFRYFNLVNLVIARPAPAPKSDAQLSVSVIVPCRNERGNIEDAIRRIPPMGRETEIIFVDGNSTDGTAQEIERQIQEHPQRNIKLIRQGQGIGKGDAVRKGFAAATGDVLVIQDADLTAPPEDLPKFYRALRDGRGEFINGSRLVYPMQREAMRFLNLLGNKFFSSLFTWLLGQRFRDTLCGTKMLSRENYRLIEANRWYFGDFDPFGDFDLIFGAVKQNLKVVEVPVTYRARTYGQTNIRRFTHGWLLLKMSWVAFKKIKWLGGRP
ncbi:MAG: glycosyltransferase [Planctomycetes bacterium]|nr:glycosyltransferase [Planctomycetota bacterium]